ncbi:MAG: hypothetical protein ABIS06_15400 [Vicinamibacterales bacterium]
MPKSSDAEIDRLFQLPLGEFTPARNALAKAAGKNGAAIKQLAKPPVAAWAVNQLYWSNQEVFEALVRASEEVRRTHKAVIEGRKGDLRSAGREHELALDAALKATVSLMKAAAQPVTDPTRHAILNTLRALPVDEEPGRLTRALMPGGFEMLSGITPARTPKKANSQKSTREAPESTGGAGPARSKHEGGVWAGTAKKAAAEKAEREAAERAVRDAEHKARRAEFEAARCTRDAERAERRLQEAQKAIAEAREELERAQSAAAGSVRARESSERKARDADSALAAARARARSAK